MPRTPIHQEILAAAIRLCRRRGEWSFRTAEIVRLLPHLNASSVRTHVVSRCCVNAPRNHPHKWDYFRRSSRGVYEVIPSRRRTATEKPAARIAERRSAYHVPRRALRSVLHAVVVWEGAWFVAECLEIAVVTQGRTLDETADALREAVALHLAGEDLSALGLTRTPRLVIQYETTLAGSDA